MKSAASHLEFEGDAAYAKFDIPDVSPDHTAAIDGTGRKNLLQPLPVGNGRDCGWQGFLHSASIVHQG